MKESSELGGLRKKASPGGGEEKIKRLHGSGKLTARERLEILLDEDSFFETGHFVKGRIHDFGLKGHAGDGVVCGYGKIEGRPVYVASQDFTILGGSCGEMHAQKIAETLERAIENGVPFIQINDGGGARIQEGVHSLNGYGRIFRLNAKASGQIPQISVIMGNCAGGAAFSPALSDFVFMIENGSGMFLTGPEVVKTVTGEQVTVEELGGASTHNAISGCSHFIAHDERECLMLVKRLLSYLPENSEKNPPFVEFGEDSSDGSLLDFIPEDPDRPFEIRQAIREIFDRESFFEIHALFAPSIIVGLARLQGRVVGVIANQTLHLSGHLDTDACDKAARFVRFCDCFNIPLVNLVDTPGFLPGKHQEHAGILRRGARLLYALSEATVPKVSLILRKAYGGAYIAFGGKQIGYDMVLSWPGAQIAVMGPEGAAKIIFRREIASSKNPEEARKKFVEEYRERFANPYKVAESGFIDRIIDRLETRRELIRALDAGMRRMEERPKKKHGNMPL